MRIALRWVRLSGIFSNQADDFLRTMTKPRLRRDAGLCVRQKSLYVRVIWPLSVSQGTGLTSRQVIVGQAKLGDRGQTIVNRKLCNWVIQVGKGRSDRL